MSNIQSANGLATEAVALARKRQEGSPIEVAAVLVAAAAVCVDTELAMQQRRTADALDRLASILNGGRSWR